MARSAGGKVEHLMPPCFFDCPNRLRQQRPANGMSGRLSLPQSPNRIRGDRNAIGDGSGSDHTIESLHRTPCQIGELNRIHYPAPYRVLSSPLWRSNPSIRRCRHGYIARSQPNRNPRAIQFPHGTRAMRSVPETHPAPPCPGEIPTPRIPWRFANDARVISARRTSRRTPPQTYRL